MEVSGTGGNKSSSSEIFRVDGNLKTGQFGICFPESGMDFLYICIAIVSREIFLAFLMLCWEFYNLKMKWLSQ